MPPGRLFAAFTVGGTVFNTSHVAECPDLGPQCSTGGAVPYRHEQKIVAADAVFDLQGGITPWLAIAATVPIRSNTSRIRYFALDGREIQPDPPDTHHRNRTLIGLGDPTIVAVIGKVVGRFGIAFRAGSMLPLGSTVEEDPYRAGREGRTHEHVQFGTGTFRPVLGSSIGVDLGRVAIDAWFLSTVSAYANSIGYRPGHRLGAGARISSAFSTRSFRFGTGLEVMRETREDWSGAQNPDGNLGRSDVLAVATAQWSPSRGWGLFAAVRVPVYVDVVGAQLHYPAVVQLGAATTFGR